MRCHRGIPNCTAPGNHKLFFRLRPAVQKRKRDGRPATEIGIDTEVGSDATTGRREAFDSTRVTGKTFRDAARVRKAVMNCAAANAAAIVLHYWVGVALWSWAMVLGMGR
jgi:hypothetical protein